MAVIACTDISTRGPASPSLPDNAITVTPSNDTYACPVTIFVGTAGSVVCTPASGGPDVTVAATAGMVIPFRVTCVKSGPAGLLAIY